MSLGNYFLKIPSGNQLQDLCNRLQVLKICIKTFSTTGNRLPESKSQFEMIEFFGQTFCFSIWKLLPKILEINLIIYLDFLGFLDSCLP